MEILLREVRIIDPSSPFHQQQADIFIKDGHIIEIGKIERSAEKVIHSQGLFVSPGWTDIFSNFCDPGLEYKETLETGSDAAASGGYTDVFVLPNTSPAISAKSGVEYIVHKSKMLPVTVHPIGAITKNIEGKELAEMYDMHHSGAIAYSDGTSPVQSSGLLLKALQYIKAVNKIIVQVPDDRSISANGLVNEGIVSTRLGIQGKPSIAEELMIARDIELAAYTNSRIHFTGISSAKSLDLIRDAKNKGIQVTCSVTPYHICFSDHDLQDYNTNLKVNPPLRTLEDQTALKAGVLDGTIDIIAAHHFPQDKDHKMVEFEYAHNGMTGLETAFAAIRTTMPQLSVEKLIALFAGNPRSIFGLQPCTVKVNGTASLTIFDPDKKWTFEKSYSKSVNSPFFGRALTGRAIGIINKDRLFLNQDQINAEK